MIRVEVAEVMAQGAAKVIGMEVAEVITGIGPTTRGSAILGAAFGATRRSPDIGHAIVAVLVGAGVGDGRPGHVAIGTANVAWLRCGDARRERISMFEVMVEPHEDLLPLYLRFFRGNALREPFHGPTRTDLRYVEALELDPP